MKRTRLELLQNMPVFGGVSEDALEFILDTAPLRRVKSGHHFFRDGDPATSMFVLESGKVAVVRLWRGNEYPIAELVSGDCFGEMALLDLGPRSASVMALDDSVALELPGAGIHKLYERNLKQFSLIQMNLARELSRRLRQADDLLFRAVIDHSLPEQFSRHYSSGA